MLITNIKLAWQFYWQEYTSNQQRLLRWVHGLLLLFIVTLTLTSNSIQNYLAHNLNGLLGADVVISQKQTLNDTQFTRVSQIASKVVVTQQINTTFTHNGQYQQAQLKAVGSDYPLQGELISSASLQSEGEVSKHGPEPGNIWLDARLLASLAISPGEMLQIGNHSFRVERVLQHEPDRLMEGHSVAMRAMIHQHDLAALNFADDLVQYRYLIAATTQQRNALITWQKSHLPAAQLFHKQGEHPLARFWQRTENFMGLASIILFFMAAIAIEQLAQVQMRKERYFSALCMSLGASKASCIQISLFKWFIGVLVLLPVVMVLAMAGHYCLVQFLTSTFTNLTWQWQLQPALKSVAAVMFIFAIFQAPVWFALIKNSVAKQFIGHSNSVNTGLSKVASILVLFIVAFIYSDNALLTAMMIIAVLSTVAIMLLMSWGGLTFGEKVTSQFSGLVPFSLFMMKQRLVSKSTQILGVGLCAFLLLFTLMLLRDLGQTMSMYQRQHDGNVFISQASSKQMEFIDNWAAEEGIKIRQVKPYLNAKLTHINDLSLDEFSDKPSDSLATFSHAIRLHWSETVPSNNRLESGKWWQEETQNWQQVSVEQEVMTDLGLKLGDTLTFYINQQAYDFTISASHAFKPGAGSITFWVQMPELATQFIEAPHYTMASIELADTQWQLLALLWQQFPTLRMVSLKEITARFDKTLAMVTQVIAGFAVMIALLALVVIIASIKAVEPKEQKKNSIILSFGFTRKTCLQLNMIEWLVTAFITATGAILGTYLAGQLIYKSQFSLNYVPDFIWLGMTLISILVVITGIGVFMSRQNLNSSIRSLFSD
ncbi:ABC transporter permease [Pseudoalteromonas sp. SSM20]|uniref:ABC transporter permease n=1 Tax=Pseudoalteromonas sp. SSM20 TaxID=3139394 RepID=UPI003BA89A64